MRVLAVWNGPTNATERAILARREVPLLTLLRAQGVEASVAIFGDEGGLHVDLEQAGIDVRVFPMALPPGPRSLTRIPAAAFRLRQFLKQRPFDLIEALEPIPAVVAGLARFRARLQAPFVYRRQHGGGRARLHFASRLAARLTDRTLVSCEAMRALAAQDDHIDPERILVSTTGCVSPPALPAEQVLDARHSLGIDDTTGVIGVVSRLRWEKGIDVLLRALDHLGSLDVHVVILGTGPEEGALRQLAARTSVPVHFLGHRDDVRLWYAVADVIAMPSRRESFGRVTLETMAAGRPLVAAAVGGLVEAVIEGETGRLVPPDDPVALAAALRDLIGNRDLARAYGAAARERFDSCHTMKHMATARRESWERVIAGVARR